MNFHSYEKQIFKSFGCTKIRNNSKWIKTSQNELMQTTTSNNDWWPNFPYHATTRQVLAIFLLTEEALFTFLVFTRVHGRASIKAARTANTWLHGHYCKLEGTFQNFEFKCLWNQKRCTPKKRYDRFPSVGDHIRAKIYCYKKFLGI